MDWEWTVTCEFTTGFSWIEERRKVWTHSSWVWPNPTRGELSKFEALSVNFSSIYWVSKVSVVYLTTFTRSFYDPYLISSNKKMISDCERTFRSTELHKRWYHLFRSKVAKHFKSCWNFFNVGKMRRTAELKHGASVSDLVWTRP